MRVLVTGGAGFIGSNAVIELVERGHSVLVIDDLSVGLAENVDPRADLARLDILSRECELRVAQFSPEAVVHLAAQSSVSVSIRQPEFDRRVNVDGTRAVAAAAREAGAARFISASSAAVYGEPAELPLNEDSPKLPINPYGASKLEAEGAVVEELNGTDTDFASMRFANVYGPRQDAAGEGGVVALFMSAVSQGGQPVIFGDGEQTRDFIYVGDVVSAILAAIESPSPLAAAGPAFNISTGKRTTVNGLLGTVADATGFSASPKVAEDRPGDIRDSVLDASRAADAFGWSATTDLATGIARTWEWWESRR